MVDFLMLLVDVAELVGSPVNEPRAGVSSKAWDLSVWCCV